MSPENAEKPMTDFLINNVTPYVIYLFGSQATQQIQNESDFDIAYLSKQKLEHYDRFMLAQELAAQLNRDVDLIDLEQASTVFQTQVINRGKILFCSDEKEKSLFEMRTLKNYAMLNEERQEVLKNIIERDQVYKNDIILNKVSTIERCIKRIKEEYDNNPLNLENYTKQDSIILNIQRACEASIDVAMHVVAERKLGNSLNKYSPIMIDNN